MTKGLKLQACCFHHSCDDLNIELPQNTKTLGWKGVNHIVLILLIICAHVKVEKVILHLNIFFRRDDCEIHIE